MEKGVTKTEKERVGRLFAHNYLQYRFFFSIEDVFKSIHLKDYSTFSIRPDLSFGF